MGGGADYFLPETVPGGKRKDGRDVIAAFRARGYTVARNPAELTAASGAKLLALFADDDMDFEIDRDPAREPTTAEMAAAALKALAQQSPNGFVLLVENENIDTAGHHNDAASLMRALWAFDDAVKVALEFQRRHPDTLVIVTGDHETGGFSPTYALKDLSAVVEQQPLLRRRRAPADARAHHDVVQRREGEARQEPVRRGARPGAGRALSRLPARSGPARADPRRARSTSATSPIAPERARAHGRAPDRLLLGHVRTHARSRWSSERSGPERQLFRGYQDNTDFGRHLHQLIRAK